MTSPCAWLLAHHTSCTEAVGAVTGGLNVWLVARQSMWAWPLGVVNAVAYVAVFARAGLYADTALQVAYGWLSLVGWWRWGRGSASMAPANPLPVTRTPRAWWAPLAAATLALWVLLALGAAQLPGAALPVLDGLLVSVSLVAQWLMTRKRLENWWLWIAVDVVYIGLFANRQLPVTAALYALFLGLAIQGLRAWTRTLPPPSPAESS
ncbi:MAG: nicotinamide riboside transporter PnuC [Gemmatimonadetes bacterium]|nr:nicotinamide riboside transporter PnuC [Gemmatimonadota bacterium]